MTQLGVTACSTACATQAERLFRILLDIGGTLLAMQR
jgi:hypothetical protein